MRLVLSAIVGAAMVAAGQSYPPPFPRPGAVKMFENLEGATPHAAYVARGTSHREEAIGSATRGTIFELK